MNPPISAISVLKKIGRIVLKTVLVILGVLILVIILIQTAPVQNFLRGKAQNYLQKKLNTKVEIGKIYIGFPKKIILERLYVEDLQKDTLLYSGELKVDLNMWKLFKSEFVINDVSLKQVTATVNRVLPDTVYNFQFIIDAFAAPAKEPTTPDTSALKIQVKHVRLNDIRLRYNDAITGNDMKVVLAHFDTNIETFDPGHSIFEVPTAEIKGLHANIYQHKPLVESEPEAVDKAAAAKAPEMQLKFKKITLENCLLDYGNDVSAFYTTLDLRELAVQAEQFDLPKRRIQLDALKLAGTRATIRLGKKPAAKLVVKEVKQEVAAEAENNWTVMINDLNLDSNHFKFDDDNAPRTKEVMDYSHLDIRNLTLQGKDILYQPDSITGTITKGALQNNDFRLNQLRARFLYTDHQAFLKDLFLETPGTRIERDIAISYPSIKSLADNIGVMRVSLDVRNSKVLTKDILSFAPMLRTQPIFANPNATWLLDGKIDGSISNLQINRLRLQGLQQTNVDVSGTLKGLPDAKKIVADLNIKNISTSATDLKNILPKGSIPSNITLPSRMTLSGKLTGSTRSLTTNLQLNSSLGSAGIKGKAANLLDTNNINYDVAVYTRSIDLQKLLNQPDLGPVTLNLTAKGKGISPKTMDAAVKGTIASATYKGYNYQNFELDGSIAQQVFAVKAGIQNEPIHIALDASGNVAGEWPSGKFDLMIDSLKTLPLNLTTENIIARAHITGDFTSTNPDSLLGELLVTKAVMVREAQRFELDTIQLNAIKTDTGQAITLQSPIVFAALYGRYKLTQAGAILQKSLEPYFSVATDDSAQIDTDYDFGVHVVVHDHPQLKNILPDLKRMDSIHLDGHFSGRGQMEMDLDIPGLIYGANEIHNLRLVSNTAGNELKAALTLQRLNIGSSLTLHNTSLNAALADNKIDFALNTRDKADKTMYHLEGILGQPQKGAYTFSLKQDSLLLNYKSWTVNPKNIIRIDTNNITADDFVLQQGSQKLAIQTVRNQPGEPLGVDFSQFKIATLLSFVQSDSMLVDGELNGNVTVSDLTTNPRFVSDLTANDLSFNKDTLGNLRMQVSNPQQDNYVADVVLSGRGNDLTLKGNYEVKPENNSTFNLKLAIQQLQLNTLEGVSMGAIKQGSGTVNGIFDVTGTLDKPSVNGELNFNKARLVPSIMNSHITIDQQKIRVTDQGIVFDKFTITDSVNNKATLDGTAYTTNFTNYKFDLRFNADNFQALNTVKKDNKLYYGTVYFDSRLNIKGTELSPSIDGSVKINDKTKLTVVLPQEDPSVVDRDGIVRFVDRDNVPNDSLFLTPYDSINTSTIRDFDVSVNITVDKGAELNLIVDEGNGDLLRVKGEANLTGGIDRSGKITLTGSYELQEGSYDLTVNFLKRKFNIQKGSKLVWQGEPTSADVDITAVYIARTAPIDLVEKQLASANDTERNKYRQKVPFEVQLKMKGELLKPVITFDIVLPEDKNYNVDKEIITASNERLAQLRQEPSELNKQVFALLLLNHFIGDNPFATGNSSMTAESFARQSVSKLLTEQLNQLAANLIEGVDINFDVASTDDYTTGEKRNRTDLNVAVSKRLLNDRLTVTVGSNFALENPNASQQSNNLAENIALDYKLSKDGRYLLRAYRRNEFEGILEGYIVETGVGIVLTLDYNRFREIFISKKQRERMRLQRRQERERLQQEEKEGLQAPEEDGKKRDIKTKQLK